MKKLLILPLVMLALCSAAQIDTAYLPPFVYLTYNSQEWDTNLNLEIDKSTLYLDGIKNNGIKLEINLTFGDTLITPENLEALLTESAPIGNEMQMMYFKNCGSYLLTEFSFSQDDCNSDYIPEYLKSIKFQFAYVIINETNLLEINLSKEVFFAYQTLQSETLEQIVKGIHIVTPQEIDGMMGFPISPDKIKEELEKKYTKSYKQSFDYNMQKRKCFDDSYFIETLSNSMEQSTLDSLLTYASDSSLCKLVATIVAERDTLRNSLLYSHYNVIGFTFEERTELFKKARTGEFTLNDYLDFHLSQGQSGPAQRLKDYTRNISNFNIENSFDKSLFVKFEQKHLNGSTIKKGYFSILDDNRFLLKCLVKKEKRIMEYQYFVLIREPNEYKVSSIQIPEDVITQTINLDENDPTVNAIKDKYDAEFEIYGDLINDPFYIQQSQKGNLLYLSTQIDFSDNYKEEYFAINSADEIKWVKLESVSIDSTKFLFIERINHSSLSDYSNPLNSDFESFEKKWNAFENSSVKSYLQNIIEEEANSTLDSIFYLFSASANVFQYILPIYPSRIDEIIELNISPDNKAIIQDGITDINNDGFEDIYSILISNGKVIEAKAYLIKANSYQIISKKEVVKLLKDNSGFKNLLLKSQIGNHGKDIISIYSNNYQATQK